MLDKTVYSNTNWAPRLGFAFDLTGDGKTVLKGHYGQYYEAILFDQYARALPGWRDYVTYSYDPTGSSAARSATASPRARRLLYPVYGVDPNMKHPRVDEWTAGIERELTKDVRLSVTGIWRQDKNIQASVYPDARWTPDRRSTERPHRPAAHRLQLGRTARPPRRRRSSRTWTASSTATRAATCSAPPGPSASTRA